MLKAMFSRFLRCSRFESYAFSFSCYIYFMFAKKTRAEEKVNVITRKGHRGSPVRLARTKILAELGIEDRTREKSSRKICETKMTEDE